MKGMFVRFKRCIQYQRRPLNQHLASYHFCCIYLPPGYEKKLLLGPLALGYYMKVITNAADD